MRQVSEYTLLLDDVDVSDMCVVIRMCVRLEFLWMYSAQILPGLYKNINYGHCS